MKGCCFCFNLRTGGLVLAYLSLVPSCLTELVPIDDLRYSFATGCKFLFSNIKLKIVFRRNCFIFCSNLFYGWCTLCSWHKKGELIRNKSFRSSLYAVTYLCEGKYFNLI